MTNLFLKQMLIGPMMNFVYLVGPAEGETCLAVDVAWDAEKIQDVAKKENRRIEAVLLTHTHYDHCNALEDFVRQVQVPVFVHEREAGQLSPGLEIRKTTDQEKLKLAGLEIECLHTPGHTPGSQCFLVDEALFTGDTLFVGNCGRVDLPDSSPADMDRSLKRIANLPENITVYPGHDYGNMRTSTIGQEKKSNYYIINGIFA